MVAFPDSDVLVTGVTINASQVVPGDVFVALPGSVHHGALFAVDAVEAGAVAVVTDDAGRSLMPHSGVPVAITPNPRHMLGEISRMVYETTTPRPVVLAVTGTNGKTSVTFFMEDICRRLGQKTALSNSSERRVAGETFRTKLTTPEANELHAMLALGAENGVATLCLEASAQAIERSRLNGIRVAVAGFTNLSHDHFEDYGDMDTYLQTKAKLFDSAYSDACVICVDTEWGEKLARQVTIPVITIARADLSPHDPAAWTYQVLASDGDTTDFVVSGPEGDIPSRVRAVGSHMVQNAAVAIVMVAASGIPVEALRQALSPEAGGIGVVVPGRLEKVSGESPVAVYVDAGRSADAYEKTLQTLAQFATGKLIAVCGTSGNRDPSKRPIMGSLAAAIAQEVIITDDDPRWEDPADIRQGLLAGARAPGHLAKVDEIPDPTEAIRHAIARAVPGDVVVWSGPGSQNYREIRGERVPFSAREETRQALIAAGYLQEGKGHD
jgi:UDP-N-acetylmuramoyl-L-alanyl-D-glutamate--2,6-diaminopimelate ligase